MIKEEPVKKPLIAHGKELFDALKSFHVFTGEKEADTLLNDLENYPHAFLLACVMDRQIKAEKAWAIPYRFKEKLGDFSITTLSSLAESDVLDLMSKPKALHRYLEQMAHNFYAATQRIVSNYGGDASKIWSGNPSSAAVVYRFLEFEGVGPKIGTMAANILAREFKVPFSDYFSIDISADVHVRRVFYRLGFTPADASVEKLIYKARELNAEFPGIMDSPCWEIGRTWCKPKNPLCAECFMSEVCPSADGKAVNQ